MFFLGISAHLFIYLLVPAFLVVWFYFRGTAGNPEAITLLPETIIYEHTVRISAEKAYFYRVEKQQKVVRQTTVFPDEELAYSPILSYDSVYYLSPALTQKALRAPPIFK